MLLKPFPTQDSGALFLSERPRALLADEPRVGKTGAAIMAADLVLATRVLVVTTKRGLKVWERGFKDWSYFDRRSLVVREGKLPKYWHFYPRVIVGWGSIAKLAATLCTMPWDLVILDESHYAKSPDTARTKGAYGDVGSDNFDHAKAPFAHAKYFWDLTGTPFPNTEVDTYPMLRALAPERLKAGQGGAGSPDVSNYDDFFNRYCQWRPKQIGRGSWAKTLRVPVQGKNTEELTARMKGFWLRRTQKDVGIRAPLHELLYLEPERSDLRDLGASLDDIGLTLDDFLDAAATDEFGSLEASMAELRRLTGEIKARLLVPLLSEELDDTGSKVVLMCWHHGVMDFLTDKLARFNPVVVNGRTTHTAADRAQERFAEDDECRVFIGQIVACGEAIDLSCSSELIFVESSFVPKDMKQAALRITNHNQTKWPRVRVATLEGTIDEPLQGSVIRKVASIRKVET